MLRTFIPAIFFAFAVPVAHADAASQTSVNVQFGDLNLQRPGDARILAERLRTAAQFVCQKANDVDLAHGRIGARDLQSCIDTATRLAMMRVASDLEANVRANLISAEHSPALVREVQN